MLKNRGRDPRSAVPSTPTLSIRSNFHRAPIAKPEPDYEVVEFPSEQYVNAKLQPPPPPPPRPPTGHPIDVDASCGLCGGGGARVRCTECGRRALCASCDDMYHRHPKRRHHQRQALSHAQMRDDRPPLPPKAAPPVPPPRRHKASGDRLSASPLPPTSDQRRGTFTMGPHNPMSTITNSNHFVAQRPQVQHPHLAVAPMTTHMGSMPYLPNAIHHSNAPVANHDQTNTLGHFSSWNRPRGSLPGFNMPPNVVQAPPPIEPWEAQENLASENWGRPLRRGTSVMELGGGPTGCPGCPHCASNPWRYGSCANLDHTWVGHNPWPQTCCVPHTATHNPRMHPHPHSHPPQTPQPYRRADNRTVSRTASRAGSRAPSPALSVRSRVSRRSKHRTPSPPPLPSSDADSESEMESDPVKDIEKPLRNVLDKDDENSLGPAPPPPESSWQCEHCTFVNEPGVRVCVVCCRTPTVKAKTIYIDVINNGLERLKLSKKSSPSPPNNATEERRKKSDPKTNQTKPAKERTSTACGPSPPREERQIHKPVNRLDTPTREKSNESTVLNKTRHDIAVGSSPPKELQSKPQAISTSRNSAMVQSLIQDRIQASPKLEASIREPTIKHSVSVGPSPPRASPVRIATSTQNTSPNFQKKFVGSSPPREIADRPLSRSSRTNTGTSPPPQSISTQTYEVPSNWDRAQSVSRSRPRRRLRDENRRERSHSRLSLSSDTRESERSVRTSGGRWEWREPRDSSPSGDWSENERRKNAARLTRRASHLDLRRNRPIRRSSVYGSEAPSPELISSNRAISLEALGGVGTRRDAERGLELARLMSEAERLGFSAAEVHAALAQNPVAPLAWLTERWPSLCAGVRAAAARLASGVNVSELEARAALAKHRGAMWPAVNECVERSRRQAEIIGIGEGRLRGHVWGSPTGVDDDAEPPAALSGRTHRIRANDSSDEFEVTAHKFQDDDWMYLPSDIKHKNSYELEYPIKKENTNVNKDNNDNIAEKLKTLLIQAGIPLIDEKLLLKGLLGNNFKQFEKNVVVQDTVHNKKNNLEDFIQSENDFIDAYNALTRLSPLPTLKKKSDVINTQDISEQNNKECIDKNKISNRESLSLDPSLQHNTTEKYNQQPTELILDKNINNEILSPVDHMISNNESISSNSVIVNKENQNEQTLNVQIEDEDKSNNLNDIFDNTQKLIQQMKNEIHSDINSLQDKSKRQSEGGESSNESHLSSEKESSYSSSEDETDDLTSDEKEITSGDEENIINSSSIRVSVHRTSSEDNENFEEAMDHIENESDDINETNIDILNSIANSLQKQSTLKLESNNHSENNQRSQDMNNNLFAAVDSFDEIYEQLNIDEIQIQQKESENRTNLMTIDKFINQSKNHIINQPNIITSQQQNVSKYKKQEINEFQLTPEIPMKLVISVNKNLFHSATIEDIGKPVEELNNILNNNGNDNKVTLFSNDPSQILNNLENTKSHESIEDIHSKIIQIRPEMAPNLFTPSIYNGEIEVDTIKSDSDIEITDKDVYSDHEKEITNKDVYSDHEKHQAAVINVNNSLSNTNQDIEDDSPFKITIVETTDLTDKEQLKTKTPVTVIKSNIPKLVKNVQNGKQKTEKNVTKVIASKVPVRRPSLKQYPAPNPPKTKFGNIQSGFVKQLQSKLFNNKAAKITKDQQQTIEAKASTSTAIQKRLAPQPPNPEPIEKTQNMLTVKEKNEHFFRETCRTEDEWTDSDGDDHNININRETEHNPVQVSPPQPITMRQISGQLIDLALIRLPDGSPERQARMLLAEGATENWEQAQLAVKLVLQGTDPPAALLAALECSDLTSALAYLHQDCELCASKFPEHEMVSMLRCTHRCCRECARHYFTVQITERSIVDCVCPYCKEPELEILHEDEWLDYFAHMDILLKTLLETEIHELFQRKLRDRTLARDPNFRWCVECSSGFFVHPKQKKIRCPECKSITCANCRKPWSTNHDSMTCEQYAMWLEDNDPERSVAAVQQHLRENGLDCPRCHFKYSLSRGGCMHFTCTQCKYEFCYGCGKPFMMGARCGLSEYCSKLGLHAHHPRNCLFYLRDKEPHELQTLLQMNNITYETESTEGIAGRCPIQLQRETPTGLIDTICGSEVHQNQAGLCKVHYVEYLAGLARTLDPIPIMEVSELVAELRRRALPLPERGPWDTDPIYAGMCAEIVREKIPLD